MKVLIACEESQAVCKAFRELGHEAYSCDILPCSGGHPGWHIQGDVLEQLDKGWDLMIAHPPCTYLSVTGNRWINEEKYGEKARKRKVLREDALEFVKKLLDANIKHIALENPVSVISGRIRKCDQVINPWEFGHTTNKRTCLWLKNLPKLKATNIIPTEKRTNEIWLMPPSKDRQKLRSKTFEGIAKAMAIQWSEYIEFQNNIQQETKARESSLNIIPSNDFLPVDLTKLNDGNDGIPPKPKDLGILPTII
jgi:hypothetical protein